MNNTTSFLCPYIPQCPLENIHNVSCTPFYKYINNNFSCSHDITSSAIDTCCAPHKDDCCSISQFPLILIASISSFFIVVSIWICCALYPSCFFHKHAKKSCTPCAHVLGYEPTPDFDSIPDKEKQ